MKKAALVLNGKLYRGDIEADYILCADGGYDNVVAKGITPDAVLGDMDSILGEPEDGVKLIKYDKKKDETDGELSLLYLIEQGFKRIDIYGAEGGRLDHVITNLNMMTIGLQNGVEVVAVCNDYDVYVAGDGMKFQKTFEAGDELSLVPFTPQVHISLTKGLEYALEDETLSKIGTRGISNIVTDGEVEIDVKSGIVFIFRIYQ